MRRAAATFVAFIVLYAVAAAGALAFIVSDDGIATIWPASGVALAAFLVVRRDHWRLLSFALVATDLTLEVFVGKIDVAPSVVFSLSLIGQAALSAWAIQRVGGVAFRPVRRADIEGLLLWGAFLVPAVAAIPPTLASWAWLSGDPWSVWFWWASSTAVAVVVLTPVLLVLDQRLWRTERTTNGHGRLEFGVIVVVIGLVSSAVFIWANPEGATLATYSFLLLPLIMWMAVRFGIPGTAVGGLVMATLALLFEGTSSGTERQVTAGLLSLEIFLVVVIGGGLIVAGLVADREEITRSLGEGLERLELATAGANIGSWNWFCQTGEFLVDDHWLTMFGYQRETFVPTINSVTAIVHPDDRRAIRKAMDAQLAGQTRVFEMEFRLLTGSGEWCWVSSRGKLVASDAEGRPEHVAGTNLDIDDRKRLESSGQLLAQLLGTAAAEVYLFDESSLALVEVSRGACENLGYQTDELMKMTALDLMPAMKRADFDALVRPLGDGPDTEVRFDEVHVRKDGSKYLVEVVLQLLIGAEQRLYFADVRDVTDRKATEHQLRQAQKMEAVGQLTGGVAHDFNNLLHVIIGSLDLLIEDDADGSDQSKALAASAKRAAERGAELTHSLLAFSRRQPLEPKHLDLNRLVVQMKELMRRSLGETIQIQTVLGGGLWTIRADAAQLESALLNLAVNARDALQGGGHLTIETANVRLDDDYAAAHADVVAGPYVMLAVSDDGEGMSAEVRDQAFEPFFTTKDVGKGTGLGLAMVYGFCRQSGGHVSIYSEDGIGTTVKLYFPRQADDRVERSTIVTGSMVHGDGEVVLVLEDDDAVRNLTIRLLEQIGYLTLGVANRDEAMALAQSTDRIDLLLTDMVLSGGDTGASVAEEIARARPGLKVLYMSGYTMDSFIDNGMFDEGVILLQKPFRRADLARKVRQALEFGDANASHSEVP